MLLVENEIDDSIEVADNKKRSLVVAYRFLYIVQTITLYYCIIIVLCYCINNNEN